MPTPLAQLVGHDDFVDRHIGPTDAEIERMLDVIGAKSLDDLLDQTVPASIRTAAPLDLPAPRSEAEVLAALRVLAARNEARTSLIGMGYTGTVTPAVIQRNVLEDPAWYTAYTPYQAEISQGRLEALLNFQTMVSELTGLPVANASLLDEATAAAEAMAMARRLSQCGVDPLRRAPRHPPADDRRARHARRAGRHRARRRRRRRARRRLLRRPVQPADVDGRGRSTGARRSSGCTPAAGSPSWPPTCWRAC